MHVSTHVGSLPGLSNQLESALLLQRCGRQPDDLSSIVLVTPDTFYIKSEAILRIGSGLRQPFPVLAAPAFIIPLPVRDAVYDQVASNGRPPAGMMHTISMVHSPKA